MNIALAGYHGFIGSGLIRSFPGYKYTKLNRELLYSDPVTIREALSGADVVINLAGAPIARRWSRKHKREIMNSRITVNRNLVKAVCGMEKKPVLFISSSAVGIYSAKGIHAEESDQLAHNFLGKVVREWEAPLDDLPPEVNRVILRTGIVLGKGRGILKMILLPTRLGMGAIIGSGKQGFSFIHLDDMLQAINFMIEKRLHGIFNVCAPHPVDIATFAKTLASMVNRPLFLKIPKFVIRLLLGKAHIVITESPYAVPSHLKEEGFSFLFPTIETALENLVKRH